MRSAIPMDGTCTHGDAASGLEKVPFPDPECEQPPGIMATTASVVILLWHLDEAPSCNEPDGDAAIATTSGIPADCICTQFFWNWRHLHCFKKNIEGSCRTQWRQSEIGIFARAEKLMKNRSAGGSFTGNEKSWAVAYMLFSQASWFSTPCRCSGQSWSIFQS